MGPGPATRDRSTSIRQDQADPRQSINKDSKANAGGSVGRSNSLGVLPKEIASLRYEDNQRAVQYYKLNRLIDLYMAEGDITNAKIHMKQLVELYSVDKQEAGKQKDIPYIKKALNTNDIEGSIKNKQAKLEEYKQAVLKASSAIAKFNGEFARYRSEVDAAAQLLAKELNGKDSHYALTVLAAQAFILAQASKRLKDFVDNSNLEPRIILAALHKLKIVWRDFKLDMNKQVADLLGKSRHILDEYEHLFSSMVSAINDGDFDAAEGIYHSIGMRFGVRRLEINAKSDIPDVKKVIEIDTAIKKYVSELADYKKKVAEQRKAITKFQRQFNELNKALKVAIADFTTSINSKEKHAVKTIIDGFMQITNLWDQLKHLVSSDDLGLASKRVALKEIGAAWAAFEQAMALQMGTLDGQLRVYVKTRVTKSDLDQSLSRVEALLKTIEKDLKNNNFFKVIALLQGILPDYTMLKLAIEIEEDDAEERKSVVIKKDDEVIHLPKLNWVLSSLLKKLETAEIQKEFNKEDIDKWRAQIVHLREYLG